SAPSAHDVCVIGGGVTGAGVALDAAARGLRTAIVERDDWASGTSWRSSKLVHGGLRYLKSGNLRLVFESLSERALLLRLAPHLVLPADFLFPVYRDRGLSPLELELGLTAYDLLALGRSPRWHHRLSRGQVVSRERLLESADLSGGALYSDARTDDSRLTFENVLDAAFLGATAVTRVEVEGLEKDETGTIGGVRARDREGGRTLTVRARVVVNAGGPWGDSVRRLEEPGVPAVLRLDRGAHLTVPAARLSVSRTIAFPLDDGRLLFAIPFGAVTLLGTTDQDHRGGPDDVFATGEDVTYLLEASRKTFPAAALSPSDILSTFAGLRPLVRQPGRNLTETSREEAILVSEGGLVTVTGGKLTTHRRIGEKAVDRIGALLARKGVATASSATRRRAFPGAPPSPMPEFIRSVVEESARENRGLSEETAAHLARRYGSRAWRVMGLTVEDPALGRPLCSGLPDIEAEVLFAAREEDARSLGDVFIRRMHLFWQAPDQGEAAMERAGDLLARELGWSREQRQASLDQYSREVARSRDWSTRTKE
ncbi:MAG TPA: glycerol-3-phosphate dehydrogenase/oxidase, partial [Thermoanaerobaculia bacterium]|nr:glycerol-3-phosphate dehydrogenase/oxidase [Thermoanaerobaculia bacterium]